MRVARTNSYASNCAHLDEQPPASVGLPFPDERSEPSHLGCCEVYHAPLSWFVIRHFSSWRLFDAKVFPVGVARGAIRDQHALIKAQVGFPVREFAKLDADRL